MARRARLVIVVLIALLYVVFATTDVHAQTECSSALEVVAINNAEITDIGNGFYRIGATGLSPREYRALAAPSGYDFMRVEVALVAVRSGYDPTLNVQTATETEAYVNDGTYDIDGTTYDANASLALQTQFAIFDIRVRACRELPPTPTPTDTPMPTNTPTDTPTPPPGGGGGGGGGIPLTPTGEGTPVPSWCGLVPQHPCYVVWATEQAQGEQTAVVLQRTQIAQQRTQIAQQNMQRELLATVAARSSQPTETPYAFSSRQTAEAIVASGPGDQVGYTANGGDTYEAYGYRFFVTEKYDFGCPIAVPNWVTLCIRYVYVRDIQLFPNFYLPTVVFVGALSLVVLGFIIRR